MIELWFPWFPKELNPNARVHYHERAKHSKEYKASCFFIAQQHGLDLEPAKMHLFVTYFPPDKRRRDDDNCNSAFKSGRDGLAAALGIDDSFFVVHPFLSDVVEKGGAVRVRITSPPAGLLELFEWSPKEEA